MYHSKSKQFWKDYVTHFKIISCMPLTCYLVYYLRLAPVCCSEYWYPTYESHRNVHFQLPPFLNHKWPTSPKTGTPKLWGNVPDIFVLNFSSYTPKLKNLLPFYIHNKLQIFHNAKLLLCYLNRYSLYLMYAITSFFYQIKVCGQGINIIQKNNWTILLVG